MNRRLASIATVLKKDVLLLWPLVLLSVAGPLSLGWTGLVQLGTLAIPIAPFAALASGLLIFLAVQSDAAASANHDWLTRPIRRHDLIIAKVIFVLFTVALPWLIGRDLQLVLQSHYTAQEVVLSFTGQIGFGVGFLGILALAGVTRDKIDMVVAVIGFFGLALVIAWLATRLSDSGAIFGGDNGWPALGWAGDIVLFVVSTAAFVLSLWLQYGRRRTWPARATMLVAVMLCYLPLFPPPAWAGTWRGQDKGVAIDLAGATACLVDEPFSARSRSATTFAPPSNPPMQSDDWSDSRRGAVGGHPKAIRISGVIGGLPEDGMVVFNHLDTTLSADGRTVRAQGGERVSRAGGPTMVQTGWLLPRSKSAVASDPNLRLSVNAWMTTHTAKTYRIPSDGQSHWVPGAGSCSVRRLKTMNVARCVNTGIAPPRVWVRMGGSTATCAFNCGTLGQTVAVQGPDDRAAQGAIVTVYRKSGRVHRRVELKGPLAQCAPPPAPATP